MEQRREARLAAAVAEAQAAVIASTSSGQPLPRSQPLRRELAKYMKEGASLEEHHFSLLELWQRRATRTTSAETGEVVEEAVMPHLAPIARLYHGIEATSCQAERNFSYLSLQLNNVRSSMSAFKVERMMFLRLNQRAIPEVHSLMEVLDRQSAARAECAKNVAVAQGELVAREENLPL